MHKASPVELRTSIEMAHSLAQIGVRFVPIPVETDEEFHTLAVFFFIPFTKAGNDGGESRSKRERPGMTTTECIFLAAGFIFCVLMLADMGLVQ
ncbi:hypothetical protein L316_27209 [Escherichia coli SHECO002]|nr:hypothetical protein L316_27209 [Escherichia coli SHECO002]